MTGYVFYDTETTGTSTDFDQILQFAAIRTDDQLNELDRIETRCRLHRHVVPHPAALRVTGMSIARLVDPALPCHYEMIREVRERLVSWSPAIFVGYNSMRFDEQLLRQALFRTLHPPYLTNTNGNARADALALVQAASVFVPGCLQVPTADDGRAVFKLDRVAPLNGFAHENAHDALADVEATIHLARCVRDRAPEVWERFVCFSSKSAVASFVEQEPAFVLTEFFFNRPYHHVVTVIGTDADNPSAMLALDLRHDPEWIDGLPTDQLATWVNRSPKPVRRVRTNAAPTLTPLEEASSLLPRLDGEQIRNRASRVRTSYTLRSRLRAAAAAEPREPSPHVEERIYAGFPSGGDQIRMERFHDADWAERVALVEAFEDERLRYHGRRLLHELRPDLLAEPHRSKVERHMVHRLLSEPERRGMWTSLPAALEATEAMLDDCGAGEWSMLESYRRHLVERVSSCQSGRI